jgi:hypothetical protein
MTASHLATPSSASPSRSAAARIFATGDVGGAKPLRKLGDVPDDLSGLSSLREEVLGARHVLG